MKRLGVLTWYIECSFEHTTVNLTLEITQETCSSSLVERFRGSKDSPIPSSPSVEMLPRGGDELQITEPYREAVRSLMWLADTTRPNSSLGELTVARHHNHSVTHSKSVVRLLSCDASTTDLLVDLILSCRGGSGEILSVCVDAHLSLLVTTRKSPFLVGGFCLGRILFPCSLGHNGGLLCHQLSDTVVHYRV